MKTRLNGEEGYAKIKDGGVMIFNQFTLIACWLLAQLYNCKLFVVCCLYSLSSVYIVTRCIESKTFSGDLRTTSNLSTDYLELSLASDKMFDWSNS